MDAKKKLEEYLHDPKYAEAFKLIRETFEKESKTYIVGSSSSNNHQIKFQNSIIDLDDEYEDEMSSKKKKKKNINNKEKKKGHKKKKIE